jgi:hypothetical protein
MQRFFACLGLGVVSLSKLLSKTYKQESEKD